MRKWHMLAACAALTIGGAICGTINATPLQALELPAPELIGAFPADQEEVEAPLDAITLIFVAEPDLVNVTIITPDQRRLVLHDAATAEEARRDTLFVLSLPEAVNLPGVYLVEISASVSDPSDNSASALNMTSSFIIAEGCAASSE